MEFSIKINKKSNLILYYSYNFDKYVQKELKLPATFRNLWQINGLLDIFECVETFAYYYENNPLSCLEYFIFKFVLFETRKNSYLLLNTCLFILVILCINRITYLLVNFSMYWY